MADQTCFVVMGFGKKTDFESGRTLDLDKTYRNVIKPAIEEAGLKCIRADEIVHSGLIDVPMYEQLLKADVVVADVSTGNKNAYYELGIRHALRPFTTLVICEDSIKAFPFDINHVAVRQYRHLGEGIDYEEAMRFRKLLKEAVHQLLQQSPRPKDSPVYTFLTSLVPPSVRAAAEAAVAAVEASTRREAEMDGPALANKIGEPRDVAPPATSSPEASGAMGAVHSILMQQVDQAQAKDDFKTARDLLLSVRAIRKQSAPKQAEDPYIVQRLALVTYKSKDPTPEAALKQACEYLKELEPDTSNDTETLGLWGAVHKRLWELTKSRESLDGAIRAYERGFYLRNDYYNGINFAFLLNERAANTADRAEAIADFVLARRVRTEVLSICNEWLKTHPQPTGTDVTDAVIKEFNNSKYWVLATMAEANVGLDDTGNGESRLTEARAFPVASWMKNSTTEQLTKLKGLLATSPLKYIRSE